MILDINVAGNGWLLATQQGAARTIPLQTVNIGLHRDACGGISRTVDRCLLTSIASRWIFRWIPPLQNAALCPSVARAIENIYTRQEAARWICSVCRLETLREG